MAFFKKTTSPPEAHPAYAVGMRMGRWLLNGEEAVASHLNTLQHRVGFRWRNGLLIALFLAFFLFFLSSLLA